MRPRFADDRVGYFEIGHLYYNDTQQKAEERAFINRWRLEPRPEDVERYKRGELVEPKKPIVLWIDPATPPVWVPYIKKGIEEWQEAFEAAGFKNAILAREVGPDEEKEFDVDDVRYSVVTYAASELANAMGPSVIDPRSGEIIEADIIWWHNVMSILHSWIRLQTGAVDPLARGNVLPTELMGNAVRFVSSHELGHSLGLKHNFAASYSVPVDSLRSKTYTDTHGTASSIMDYARFNYVAQPEDGITQLTPKIGVYDKHAIRWGYRWLDVRDPHEELPTLNAWLREHENDPEYRYGEQSKTLGEKYDIMNVIKDMRRPTSTEAVRDSSIRIYSQYQEELDAVREALTAEAPVSDFALYFIMQNREYYYMTPDTLSALVESYRALPEFAENRFVSAIDEYLQKELSLAVGNKAPDFTLNTPDGKPVTLSEFYPKGKVTMIDFWASWCGPCRNFNPTLVKIYNKYHKLGFEIIGVSLDRDHDAWVKGIKDDKLTWTHVSDLKFWQSEVGQMYNVNFIPQNTFVDSEGNIIGRKVAEDEIEALLDEYLKK